MIKGDTALDMRGRCSAGQKVPAFYFWYRVNRILKPDWGRDCGSDAFWRAREGQMAPALPCSSGQLPFAAPGCCWLRYVSLNGQTLLQVPKPIASVGDQSWVPAGVKGSTSHSPQAPVLPVCLSLVTTDIPIAFRSSFLRTGPSSSFHNWLWVWQDLFFPELCWP